MEIEEKVQNHLAAIYARHNYAKTVNFTQYLTPDLLKLEYFSLIQASG